MKDNNDTLKKAVLDSDLDIEEAQAHKALAVGGDFGPYNELVQEYGSEAVHIARNINKARYERAKRCRSKVGSSVISGKAYFLTLTFRDEVLSKTMEKTRRRKVSRALKEFCSCYVANIDYGDKKKNPQSNEREHYHALVELREGCTHKQIVEEWERLCGFAKAKKVGNTEKDCKKVAKYTAKLSAHALKRSTDKDGKVRAPRLIYSRNAITCLVDK